MSFKSESNHSESTKVEDIRIENIEKNNPPALNTHYDPTFISKTM